MAPTTQVEVSQSNKRRNRISKRKPAEAKLSRRRKPDGMQLDAWQRALRRQFGRDQQFEIVNIGDHPVFSEYHVTNPASKNTYRVAVRGTLPGENYCSCPDFATNDLGTCKHIEFALAKLERRRGGKTALRNGFHPPYSEIYLQYGAQRIVRFRPGEECPAELARLANDYFDDERVLLPEAFGRFDAFLSKAAGVDHDLRCYDDALSYVAEIRDQESRRSRVAKAFPRGIHSARFKNLLKVSLYDYQREGALFAARAGRCLIGDEMGLGKTVQALAAAEIMATEFGVERVLIVCPTSLKHQWEREIERFTDRDSTVIYGLRAEREKRFRAGTFYTITNYDTVHRDLDLICELSPDLVILDEAQRIKNWETRVARTVKKINSPYCIVLTGTPLENRLEELVSIVQFIDKHRLGPTYRFLHEHQDLEEETGRVIGYRNLDQIGRTLEPMLIRRQKSQVLDQLPPRLEKLFFVPMTQEQRRHHDENRDIVARIVNKWRRFGFLSESDQRRLMIALQNMRMSCNSTYLLDKETDHSFKPDELSTLLDEVFEKPATKAVVFSQWTRTHELSLRRVNGRAWDHVFFHGGVDGRDRKKLIDRFREDPNCRVFFSTDAGGVGLNLQHACVVVNMDLPWNPAVLEQRIGRVHRLGQTQPVQVVNFVAENTIEHGMLSVLAFKKSLFAGVLDGGEKNVFLGESRLKKFMETVDKVTATIPTTPLEPEPAPEEEEVVRDESAEVRSDSAVPAAAAPARPSLPSSRGRGSAESTAPPIQDTLGVLVAQGLTFLEQLASAAKGSPRARSDGASRPALKTVRDEASGQSFLQIPMPEPETLDRALKTISSLLENFRR